MNDSKEFRLFGFHVFITRICRYTVVTHLEGRQQVHFDHFYSRWLALRFARKCAYANSLNFDVTVTCKVFLHDQETDDMKLIRAYQALSVRKVRVF